MGLQTLLDQAEEERQRCEMFGNNPFKSKRYRSIQRQITIRRENSIPVIRHTRTVCIIILIPAMPITLVAGAYVISETIKILISCV